MKISVRCSQKTKTFQQFDIQECELTTRHLLCQNAIFQYTGSDIQRRPLSYVDEQMTMKKLQRIDKLVLIRQKTHLWVKRSSPDTEIGKVQHFNE